MARAISMVATTKIKKTSTAPTVVDVCWAKVTRLRLTPFSISSMHISMTRTWRRTMTPTRPRLKSATAAPMRSWVLSIRPPLRRLAADPDRRQRRHDRGDEQHRGELEEQPVLAEKVGGEGGDAVAGVADLALRRGQRAPHARGENEEQHQQARRAWDH